ncbi:MAG TPA: hypothetical protein VGI12_19915 [Vicinamibacterales bacterium]
MVCDAPHGVQLLIAAIGVLPAPAAAPFALEPGQLLAAAQFLPDHRVSVPLAPPPRLD